MTTKTFDAVRNKHEAAQRILAQIKNMTLDEQVAYWAQGTKELCERQDAVRRAQQRE